MSTYQAKRHYSPYENEAQRAQAADRAQIFLNKINGEREGLSSVQRFKKAESARHLSPVIDRPRRSQSRRSSTTRSSLHVCPRAVVCQRIHCLQQIQHITLYARRNWSTPSIRHRMVVEQHTQDSNCEWRFDIGLC